MDDAATLSVHLDCIESDIMNITMEVHWDTGFPVVIVGIKLYSDISLKGTVEITKDML